MKFNSLRTFCLILSLLICSSFLLAQNKTERPTTYAKVCFYTIEKGGFERFLEIAEAVQKGEERKVQAQIRKMLKDLRKFDSKQTNRSFELWYRANYSDFEQQVEVVRSSTIKSLQIYRARWRSNQCHYFDHTAFLMQVLAFESERFYPHYWFMGQERYFSETLVENIRAAAPARATDIFEYSDLHQEFEVMQALQAWELDQMKRYLQIGPYGTDTEGIGQKPLIPYSYGLINRAAASYLLQQIEFDDRSLDLDLNRQVRALERFLKTCRAGEIYLLVRFEGRPFQP
ncbi:hypothetical protein PPO43_02460 [Saprospira sp. CCB-QB6]|uniref:hypothetical protein n=1 Tax=Saprospira sp. CCB-QB6 TaxID=3023936 RepID=UPI0023495FE6|nr:hypothetical protein [Saprospira sp. CCB-QB6]WCL81962.1 hypothetical protein PPO43_02460 [Saprospira sp. CCB-QB6]